MSHLLLIIPPKQSLKRHSAHHDKVFHSWQPWKRCLVWWGAWGSQHIRGWLYLAMDLGSLLRGKCCQKVQWMLKLSTWNVLFPFLNVGRNIMTCWLWTYLIIPLDKPKKNSIERLHPRHQRERLHLHHWNTPRWGNIHMSICPHSDLPHPSYFCRYLQWVTTCITMANYTIWTTIILFLFIQLCRHR